MHVHIVTKHIRCLPCQHLIDVRKFRTTQGAETEADKRLQDQYIDAEIGSRKTLGFYICPKCQRQASVTDTPIYFWGNDGSLLRDKNGKPISRYADQIDTAQVEYDFYGHAHPVHGTPLYAELIGGTE